MVRELIPFALPDIGDEEIAEVVDSLRSGWITSGPKAKRFEQQFAEFIGDDVHAVAVNSATAGLHLALEAVRVGPGDEVITTTHTFTATAEVVRYLGADPVFVDIDPKTLCIDARAIEGKLSPRTKAIIPVHFAGMACDVDVITALAARRGLKVIEDAAHALPATCNGKLVGALGSEATVFSFYATKTIATGEGGMVVTHDPKIAERCRVMRLHGINRDAFDRYTSARPAWYYEVVAPGFKYNLTDLAAALGIHQLRKAWRFQKERQSIAEAYDKAFAELPVRLPPRPRNGDVHAWRLYVLQLERTAPVSRDEFIKRMFEAGIGCSVHFIPLHLQPYWRDTYRLQPSDFPVSLSAFEQSVSLPIYMKMSLAARERVIEAVYSILR